MSHVDAAVTEDLCLGFGEAGVLAKGCRPAPTCSSALAEATRRWPGRNRASDGICGDPAHQARVSDHNPDGSGFAHAFDLTHHTAVGLDTHRLADQLRLRAQAGVERRVKYIISNRRIASSTAGWAWRSYGGANPHSAHMHVSVTSGATHDTSPWFAFLTADQPPPTPSEEPDAMGTTIRNIDGNLVDFYVVPDRTGISMSWRAEHEPGQPWYPDVILPKLGKVVSSVSALVQEGTGNIVLTATVDHQRCLWWRSSKNFQWYGPTPVTPAGSAA